MINLDPAVFELPYEPHIDIRDTVNYKEVMKQYQLGPNGAILTSLNLFTTKFDQVLDLLAARSEPKEPTEVTDGEEKKTPTHVIVDTPGQIEIFTWSASGAIITEALAAQYPTVLLYLVDTPRCRQPATFMSNMLYACSILFKTQLPMLLVFNKTDLDPADFCLEWMQDVLLFQEALAEDPSYMASMVQSMSLMLDEFYRQLRVAAVSSLTGEGMDQFFEKLQEAVDEYDTEYRPMFERRLAERLAKEKDSTDEQVATFVRDISLNDK